MNINLDILWMGEFILQTFGYIEHV